jgi:hypothetical protein
VAFALSPLAVSTIWAFCLMTSAGVRMAQETSSAIEDAAEWMIGWGRSGEEEPERVGLYFVKVDLTPS